MTDEERAERLEEIRGWMVAAPAWDKHRDRTHFLLTELDRVTAERERDRKIDIANHDKFLAVCEERDAAIARAEKAEAERDAKWAQCDECAFRYDAFHVTQATGKHDCPVCGEGAALEQVKTLTLGLRNVRLLAARLRNTDMSEWADHLLRFCSEAGVEGSVLRERDEPALAATAPKEGE